MVQAPQLPHAIPTLSRWLCLSQYLTVKVLGFSHCVQTSLQISLENDLNSRLKDRGCLVCTETVNSVRHNYGTGWNETVYQEEDCHLSPLKKEMQCTSVKRLNTGNLVLTVSQLVRATMTKTKQTFKELRLKPVAVNPWVMACPCDFMAMHFLQCWSGESLSHPTTSTNTSLTLLSTHLCMLCAGCQRENGKGLPVITSFT